MAPGVVKREPGFLFYGAGIKDFYARGASGSHLGGRRSFRTERPGHLFSFGCIELSAGAVLVAAGGSYR